MNLDGRRRRRCVFHKEWELFLFQSLLISGECSFKRAREST